MSNTYQQLGMQIGELVDQKNAAYGSSFSKCGDFLRLLFPDGIRPERYDDALLQVRIFDKQMRIATDKDAFGESPYGDIAGYGLLGTQLHAERKSEGCGSVREDAGERSTEQNASAEQSARPSTAAIASELGELSSRPPSTPPSAPTSAKPDAPVPTAVEAAALSVVGRALERNRVGCCGFATDASHLIVIRNKAVIKDAFDGLEIAFCGPTCYRQFMEKFVKERQA